MLPVALRAIFGPGAIAGRFRNNFPLLMMLRPWQLRATLEDGATMLEATAAIEPGYCFLQMPIFILAGGEDRLVDPWHSEKLHGEVHASQLQVVPAVGHMVQHSVRPSGQHHREAM